jgi:hypothetical protein
MVHKEGIVTARKENNEENRNEKRHHQIEGEKTKTKNVSKEHTRLVAPCALGGGPFTRGAQRLVGVDA